MKHLSLTDKNQKNGKRALHDTNCLCLYLCLWYFQYIYIYVCMIIQYNLKTSLTDNDDDDDNEPSQIKKVREFSSTVQSPSFTEQH